MTRYEINTTRIGLDSPPKSTSSFKPKKSLDRRWIWAAAIVLALGVGAWIWAARFRTPSPTASLDKIVKFTATDKFAQMTPQQKQPYLDALSNAPRDQRRDLEHSLSDDERQRARENMMGSFMQKQMDAYFALPQGPERVAYLDKMIDREQEWQSRASTQPTTQPGDRRAGGPGGGGPGGRNRGGDPAARMKSFMDHVPPEQMARMQQFHKEMQMRRIQRGLPATRRG